MTGAPGKIEQFSIEKGYDGAINYLLQTGGINGLKHPLSRLIEVCLNLSSPQEKIKVIHIAGTNGKGSSCAMLSEILMSAGYKTGVFTSPHLTRFNERIKVNGREISDCDFTHTLNRVIAAALPDRLSFFETLTLMAFLYFYENSVDFAIIETGIGGRLDSTNIVSKPILSVITQIGYDHINLLGESLASIAREKAGIIKKNSPAVLYLNTNEVYNIVNDVARGLGSPFYYDKNSVLKIISADITGTDFFVSSDYFEFDNLRLNLFGGYQVQNARGALLAVRALNDAGVYINEGAVRAGLMNVKWRCRAEIVKTNPLIIIDGAHNINGAYALSEALEYFKGKRIILVIGMLKTKPYADVLAHLSRRAQVIILTKPPGGQAADLVLSGSNVYKINDYREAAALAVSMAAGDGVVCVTGSLYLAGAARAFICGK